MRRHAEKKIGAPPNQPKNASRCRRRINFSAAAAAIIIRVVKTSRFYFCVCM